MSATEQLTSGFDFAEAIEMPELTQHASQLFEQSIIGNKVFVEYYNQQMQGFSYRVQNLWQTKPNG